MSKNDRYRRVRYVLPRVTDDAESRGDADGAVVDRSPADAAPDDGADPAEFGDLTLPQRAFVAAVQNPTRGVVIVGLLAFAFSFYIAFWLTYPRVAAFLSVIGVVLVGAIALLYVVSDRFSQ